MGKEIPYSIPNIGPVMVSLYEPADAVFDLLHRSGEIERLQKLRHIGSLEFAYPGISHTRWDYTMAILYVISRIKRLTGNSSFAIGTAEFSSTSAALQCLALLTNIGHLPGTYGVEKGIARFLSVLSPEKPIDPLVKHVRDKFKSAKRDRFFRTLTGPANRSFLDSDYLSLNRILGVLKLATNFRGSCAVPDWLVQDFYAPYVLSDLRLADTRWFDLVEHFDTVRRLAYLNQDTTLVDSPVSIALSPLLSNLVDPDGITKEALTQSREILGAYEHTVFERFYHRSTARKVLALTARLTHRRIENLQHPEPTILRWLSESDLSKVVNASTLQADIDTAHSIGSISIRSFDLDLSTRISFAEKEFVDTISPKDTAVGVQCYVPPRSRHSLEARHDYLDAFVLRDAFPRDTGLFIKWLTDELDTVDLDIEDEIEWLTKIEIGRAYEELWSHAFRLGHPEIETTFRPWPLSRLGKFHARDEKRDEVCIWFAAADLEASTTKSIVRKPSVVPSGFGSIRYELDGLAQLRNALRETWKGNKTRPRKRFYISPASIFLTRQNGAETPLIREFDGGILEVSARTGSPRFYLLETKGGATSKRAENELAAKMDALEINATLSRLPRHSAYATIAL